jgi:hypothetical protein
MAKNHGARQQKRVAKQKAKRSAKRFLLLRRFSRDPAIRLQGVAQWPVVAAFAGKDLWKNGISYLLIARQEPQGALVFAVFLVDVFCLGVKNAFWRAGTAEDFEELLEQTQRAQSMRPIGAECLAKVVKGAVEYAESLGFEPHPDYRHASLLLDGIDPSACPNQFTYGKDGRPFYIQGPHESHAQVVAIMARIKDAGGHYFVRADGFERLAIVDDEFDEIESVDEDDALEEGYLPHKDC